MATDSSTLLQPEKSEPSQLGSILTYPEWKESYSNISNTVEDDLPNYLDYYRGESFKRGELTRDKEAEIQSYYVDWFTGGDQVSDDEFFDIASNSTALKQGTQRQANFVSQVFPSIDWASLDPQAQQDYLNRSKKALVNSGQLPFASIEEQGRGSVYAGNFDSSGTSESQKVKSSADALKAMYAGAIDPRDLWQVTEGLGESPITGRNRFQAMSDSEDIALVRDLLGQQGSEISKAINDAITSTIDLESYRDEGSLIDQIFADRPEDIDQIILKEFPEKLKNLQPLIVKEIAKRKGLGDVEGAGLNTEGYYKSANKRAFEIIRDLAITHANNQGAFKYEEEDLSKNIRVTPLGIAVAHPELMKLPNFNEIVNEDKRLSDGQKEALKNTRENFIIGTHIPTMDVIFNTIGDTVGKKWVDAKTENPSEYKNNPIAFYENFVKDKSNYSKSKNFWYGINESLFNAVPSIGYSVGALLGNEASAKKLTDFQNKQAARKRVASLFGDDFGFGYDLATAVPQVFSDLAASALTIKGATTIASKLPDLGAVNFLDFQKGFVNDALTSKPKTNFESASQKRIKELIKESSKDSTKVKAAISKNNEYIATKLAVPVSLFATSAARSGGSTYATIYSSLPDDMSHEEKHDKALGGGLLSGAITGGLTVGFSKLNMGGVEDIVSKYSFRRFKNGVNNIKGASWANDNTTKKLVKSTLATQFKEQAKIFATKTRTGAIFKSGIFEGIEEGTDEFINSFVESSYLNEFVPMGERINNALYAGKLGAFIGGPVGFFTYRGPDVDIFEELETPAQSTNVDPQKVLKIGALEDSAEGLQENNSPESAQVVQEEAAKLGMVNDPQDQGSQVQDIKIEEPLFEEGENVFNPDFDNLSEFDEELIRKYIQGWAPSKEGQQEIQLEFLQLEEGRPMRVGIAKGSNPNDPKIVWQIDSAAIAQQLNALEPTKESYLKKEVLDNLIAHELIHVSENNYLKGIWRQSEQGLEAGTDFVDFAKSYLGNMYLDLVGTKAGKKLAVESVARHLGIKTNEVVLPTAETLGSSGMTMDEVVSEMTRQFVELSKGSNSSKSVADFFKGIPESFLRFIQGVVAKVRVFTKPENVAFPKDVKEIYKSLDSQLVSHLNSVEDSYVEILKRSLQGRRLIFETASNENLETTPQETPVEAGALGDSWSQALSEYEQATSWSNDLFAENQIEQSLSNVARAHILANPLYNINEAQLDLIASWYNSNVLGRKLKNLRNVKFDFEIDIEVQNEDGTTTTRKQLVKDISSADSDLKIDRRVRDLLKSAYSNAKKSEDYLPTLSDFLIQLDADINGVDFSTRKEFVLNNNPSESYSRRPVPTSSKKLQREYPDEDINEINQFVLDTTEFFDSLPELQGRVVNLNYESTSGNDPIMVSDGEITLNVYALPNLVKVPKNEWVSQVNIKLAEDKFLNEVSSEELQSAYNELGPSILAFLSSELNTSIGTETKSEADIVDDNGDIIPEVAEEIVKNLVRKYTSDVLSDSDIEDIFSIISSYSGLRGLAIKSIDSINNSFLESSDDFDLVNNEMLEEAASNLKANKIFDSNDELEVPFDDSDTTSSLDFIRNVIVNKSSPSLRTRLEVPIGILKGGYQKPKIFESLEKFNFDNRLQKFWNFLAGYADPRWRREQERRQSFYAAIKVEGEMFVKNIDKVVKRDYKNGWDDASDLVSVASGTTEGANPSEEFRTKVASRRDAAIDRAKKNFNGDVDLLKEKIKEARANERERLSIEKERIRKAILRDIERAHKDIQKTSPELSRLIREARKRLTEAANIIAEDLGIVNPSKYGSLKLKFSKNEGFYLTRSYLAFKDAKYRNKIENSKSEKYRVLRVQAGKRIKRQQIDRDINSKLLAKDKEAYKNGDTDWLLKSEALKRELVERQVKEAEKFIPDTEYEKEALRFLEKLGDDPETDVLMRKNELLSSEVRDFLGEIQDPRFNLVNSLATVKAQVNQIYDGINLMRLSRVEGDKDESNWWAVTTEEYQSMQEEDPARFEELGWANFKPVLDKENNKSSIFPSRFQKPFNPFMDASKGWFIHPDLVDFYNVKNKQEARAHHGPIDKVFRWGVFFSLGTKTLGSSTYFTRNIAGALTYFPAMQGTPIARDGDNPRKIMGVSLPRTNFKELMSELSEVGVPQVLGDIMGAEGPLAQKTGIQNTVNDLRIYLFEIGLLEPEITTALIQDMLSSDITEARLEQDFFDVINKIYEENGLPSLKKKGAVEELSLEVMGKIATKLGKKGVRISQESVRTLQRLSLATDAFYKIRQFAIERNYLERARQWDQDNLRDTGYASLTNEAIDMEAVNKIKQTAQYYSQSPKIYNDWKDSIAGGVFGSFLRFRLETWRITTNSFMLAKKERASENPIIKSRGTLRLKGAATTSAIMSLSDIMMERIFYLGVLAPIGHTLVDGLEDDERSALQLAVPSFLRDHTFLYSKDKEGKLHSWDLTYVNPFSPVFDVPSAMVKAYKADENIAVSGAEAFLKQFVAPFVDPQIAVNAYMGAFINNEDSRGNKIAFNNDSVLTRIRKQAEVFLKEAYTPPTLLRKSENFMEGGEFNFKTFLKNYVSPIKPYVIDPDNSARTFHKGIKQDLELAQFKLNRAILNDNYTEEDVIKAAKDSVEQGKIAAKLMNKYRKAFTGKAIGANVDVFDETGKRSFTKGKYDEVINRGRWFSGDLSDKRKETLDSKSLEKYEVFLKEVQKIADEDGFFIND